MRGRRGRRGRKVTKSSLLSEWRVDMSDYGIFKRGVSDHPLQICS
jgi:hypothetical protein